MTMSKHVQYDRTDRMVYIAMTVGFGNILFEKVHEDKRECVTDTGVLLVKSLDGETLITAFILNMDKAICLYRTVYGDRRMPTSLHQTILKNRKHCKNQNIVTF